MSNSTNNRPERLDAKTSIALMRKALRAAFPGVKFSVRMSRGTAYGNANVRWTDGPTTAEVQEVTEQFRGEGFDGMTDSTTYTGRTVEYQGKTWRSGVGLVLVTRDNSPEAVAGAIEQLKAAGYDEKFPGSLENAAEAMLRGCEQIVAAQTYHLERRLRLVK